VKSSTSAAAGAAEAISAPTAMINEITTTVAERRWDLVIPATLAAAI
jgi:hypothetical protein